MGIPESVKADLMAKCGRCCCLCHKLLPLILHHIIEVGDDGTDEPDNLIPLCLNCHGIVHTETKLSLRYRPGELRQRRDSAYRLVAEGKLPPTAPSSATVAVELLLPTASPDEKLSAIAIELLVKAAQGNGYIIASPYIGGCKVQAGGQLIIDTSEARVQAKYRGGIDQLEYADLIEPRGDTGQVFAVTDKGYLLADELIAAGSAP